MLIVKRVQLISMHLPNTGPKITIKVIAMFKKISLLALFSASLLVSSSINAESPPEIFPENHFYYYTVTANDSPYSMSNRKDYSVNFSSGRGVVVAPNWVLTASHVISSRYNKNPKKVHIRWKTKYKQAGLKDKVSYTKALKIYRHPYLDLALVHTVFDLTKRDPARNPVLLLKEPLTKKDGKVKIKKVSSNMVWRDIPARVVKGGGLYVSKNQRKGKAGTSGAPWLIEGTPVGDVLVGITHGTGLAPQVALAKRWMAKIIEEATPEQQLYFAAKKDVLKKPVFKPVFKPVLRPSIEAN